jgi:hypothetical protein
MEKSMDEQRKVPKYTNEERNKALEVAAAPLAEFMNEYCDPHSLVTVEQGHIVLYTGECGLPFPVRD